MPGRATKNLKFRIESGDYFINLATLINAIAEEDLDEKMIVLKRNILAKLAKELLYMQDNYRIFKK